MTNFFFFSSSSFLSIYESDFFLFTIRGALGKIRIYLYNAVDIYDLFMREASYGAYGLWTAWVFSSHLYSRDSMKLFLLLFNLCYLCFTW